MEQGLFWFKPSSNKIEYSSENKVIYVMTICVLVILYKMVANNAYLGFPSLGLEESDFFGKTTLMLWVGYKMRKGSKNVVLRVERKALGVVRVSGASSYGVPLPSAWIL